MTEYCEGGSLDALLVLVQKVAADRPDGLGIRRLGEPVLGARRGDMRGHFLRTLGLALDKEVSLLINFTVFI